MSNQIPPALTRFEIADTQDVGYVARCIVGLTTEVRAGVAGHAVKEPSADELHRITALANAALPDDDPRKLRREHVTALEDAFMKLHGPKMDAPRNDTERGLLRLSEILTSLLP